MGEGSAEYAKRAARVKNLLASYYGGDDDAGGRLSSAQQPAGDSLDATTYNVERHTSQMMKTHQLEKILAEHSGITKDIKSLDSQLQQLVYQNYTKFMEATDTVRTMKSTVDSMGGDITRLNATIGT